MIKLMKINNHQEILFSTEVVIQGVVLSYMKLWLQCMEVTLTLFQYRVTLMKSLSLKDLSKLNKK